MTYEADPHYEAKHEAAEASFVLLTTLVAHNAAAREYLLGQSRDFAVLAEKKTALATTLVETLFNFAPASNQHRCALFARLFDAAPTHRVVRFLSDLGSTSDALAIVRALPPGPFLREAGAALLRRPLGEVG